LLGFEEILQSLKEARLFFRRKGGRDWEGDTIVGAHHKGALLTHVERKSLFTTISKLPRSTATAAHAPRCVG